MPVQIEKGKCYLIKHKLHPGRKNAKIYEMKVQILEIQAPFAERQLIITNHRPWHEGGSGRIYLDEIIEAIPIERGPFDR